MSDRIVNKSLLQKLYGVRPGVNPNAELDESDYLNFYMINTTTQNGLRFNDKVFTKRIETLNGKKYTYLVPTGVEVVDVKIEQILSDGFPGVYADKYTIIYSNNESETFNSKTELIKGVTDGYIIPAKGTTLKLVQLQNGSFAFVSSDFLAENRMQYQRDLEDAYDEKANQSELRGKIALKLNKKLEAETQKGALRVRDRDYKIGTLQDDKKKAQDKISTIVKEKNELKKKCDYYEQKIKKITGKDSRAAQRIFELITDIRALKTEMATIKGSESYNNDVKQREIDADLKENYKALQEEVNSVGKERDQLAQTILNYEKTFNEMKDKEKEFKAKRKQIIKKAIASVLIVGLATGITIWVGKTHADKFWFQDKVISQNAQGEWDAMLENKLGQQVIDSSIRGQDGVVEFIAKEADSEVLQDVVDEEGNTIQEKVVVPGKITFYTAQNNAEVKEWSTNKELNKVVENFAKDLTSKADNWLNTFNTESMTALFNGINNDSVKLVSEFSISGGKDVRVIDGKDYNLNGFVNDKNFTGTDKDAYIAFAEDNDGKKVVVENTENGKVAYVTMVVMPKDHNEDATVIKKAVYYGPREVKTEEDMIVDAMRYGQEVSTSNIYNPVNESELTFSEVTEYDEELKEYYSEKEARPIVEDLIIARALDFGDEIIGKVNEFTQGENKVVYYKYEDVNKGESIIKVVYDKENQVTESATYQKLQQNDATKIIYRAVTGDLMNGADSIYANSEQNYDPATGASTGVLDVLAIKANGSNSEITEKDQLVKASSKTTPMTIEKLVEVAEKDISGKSQEIKGDFWVNRKKGTKVVNQDSSNQDQSGTSTNQSQGEGAGLGD